MNSKEFQNQVPFKGLSDFDSKSGKYFKVNLPIGNPDFVIKEPRTEWREGDKPGIHPLNDFERVKQDLDAYSQNFSEFIPKTSLVRGKNQEGLEVVYIVQEKISGKSINELPFSPEVEVQLKNFFDKITQAFIKNFFYADGESEPRSIYPELNPKNFIVGTKKADPNPKLWFVDTYPMGGGTTHHFTKLVLPRIVSWFSDQWKPTMEKIAQESEILISNYLSENKNSIPKQNKNSVYRL